MIKTINNTCMYVCMYMYINIIVLIYVTEHRKREHLGQK